MRFFKTFYFWILIALFLGIGYGLSSPHSAIKFEPLAINFIKLIRMFIGPIIFLTVASGVAHSNSWKKLGRTGIKTLVYFEVLSSLALLIGWGSAHFFKPGANLHINPASLNTEAVSSFLHSSEKLTLLDFIQTIIPSNVITPFAEGNLLQIFFMAILFGIALLHIGSTKAQSILKAMDLILDVLFQIIRQVMYLAPFAVFGAMAFAVGKFGADTLLPLLKLIATFYFSVIVFIGIILGSMAHFCGFSLLKFLKFLLPEFVLIFGTSSSESALPQLLRKLEKLGCKRDTIGIVVPTGYSFNLDGTNIYITLSALFIAQALGIELTLSQQFTLFLTAMITSKGAAGVAGAGFVTLASTLIVLPEIPVAGLVLILGIDRFMSEARAFTNFIGNAVAALVISRWEKEVSAEILNQRLIEHMNDDEEQTFIAEPPPSP